MGDNFTITDKVGAVAGPAFTRPAATESVQQETGPDGSISEQVEKTQVPKGEHLKGQELEDETRLEPVSFTNRFQVKLDGATGQVFTDILDSTDEKVVGRIPSYFKPSDEVDHPGSSAPGRTAGPTKVTI